MQANKTPPSPTELAGPLLIGYLLNWGLNGILCVQMYTYYIAFPNDVLRLKILVYGIFILEIIQTAIVTNDAYDTFANGLGDPTALDDVHKTWISVPLLGGIVACIGQLFFAYRIKVLSRSWISAMPIICLSIIAVTAAMISAVQTYHAKYLSHLKPDKLDKYASGIWNGGCAVCDVVIAACMTYYLTRHDTVFNPRTHLRITRLVRVTVETGIVTATAAVLNLVLFLGGGDTDYFTVPAVTIAKLYSNTILVILNNRITIIGGRDDVDNNLYTSWDASVRPRWRLRQRTVRDHPVQGSVEGIAIHREVWTDAASFDRLEVEFTPNPAEAGKSEALPMTKLTGL